MDKIRNSKFLQYFTIGAVLGAVLFLCIYGVDVLDFTCDKWLLNGQDLNQHYVGWKFFRKADWTFPIGMHDGLTHPHYASVLYTDSIPLFAIFFKILSPILPETFQYFGLFGLLCYMLNGGVASVVVAKINDNKIFCACVSVFFILATPILQRMFGHTALAAHFLIFGAIGIWMYRERFEKYWKAALAFSILGVLCVLIQMYIIFIVGGIMCGYLLHCLLKDKCWKRVFVVFGCFLGSFLVVFWVVGGFSDVLTSGSDGFGLYSSNLNSLVNPCEYSTFFKALPLSGGQYEGFAYLGLGMIVLCIICVVLLIRRGVQLRLAHQFRNRVKGFLKRHYAGLISVVIVVSVFAALAVTTRVYMGRKLILQIYLSDKLLELLAVIRSSGRFMWVVMYMIMIAALYVAMKMIRNKRVAFAVVAACLCLQLADLARPIRDIHQRYDVEFVENDSLVSSEFWDKKLGKFRHIVYFPINEYGLFQMLQIGTKASMFDIDVNYFYLSRFYKSDVVREENARLKTIFETDNLSEDTLYILNYKNAHLYKDKCNIYEVDNKIIACKRKLKGLTPYHDVFLSRDNPLIEREFAYNGLGRAFTYSGWVEPVYGDSGMWTSSQSVLKLFSEGINKAHISIEYESGSNHGETWVDMNGARLAQVPNNQSGVIEFDTVLEDTPQEQMEQGGNLLFLSTSEPVQRGIYVKKITVTYIG